MVAPGGSGDTIRPFLGDVTVTPWVTLAT